MFLVKLGTSITGVENMKSQTDMLIYPNPSSGTFSIEAKADSFSLVITDVAGRKVYQNLIKDELTEMNLSHLPKGIYFVKLLSKNNSHTEKIVID